MERIATITKVSRDVNGDLVFETIETKVVNKTNPDPFANMLASSKTQTITECKTVCSSAKTATANPAENKADAATNNDKPKPEKTESV